MGARALGVLPSALRRRVLRSAFDRARDAFNRGDIEAVMALFADDVEYVPPPPLGATGIRGLPAVLGFWRDVFGRYERSTIENLTLEEADAGRIVRRARLRHLAAPGGEDLEYTILQTTWIEAGRVVRQINEIDPS